MGVATVRKRHTTQNVIINQLNPKESKIQSAILDFLRRVELGKRVVRIERRNGGVIRRVEGEYAAFAYHVYLPGHDPINKGIPDIEGVFADGRLFCIEVKREGKALVGEQVTVAAHCQKYSIPHLVARSVDDVVAWLDAVFPRK